jgi:hypothetical protein
MDRVVGVDAVDRLMRLWGLSEGEAARALGVSRNELMAWLRTGVPSDRATAVADMAAATDVLDRHVRMDRIPGVVRTPAPLLGGYSLYDMACEGRHTEVRAAVTEMFDLRRVQP